MTPTIPNIDSTLTTLDCIKYCLVLNLDFVWDGPDAKISSKREQTLMSLFRILDNEMREIYSELNVLLWINRNDDERAPNKLLNVPSPKVKPRAIANLALYFEKIQARVESHVAVFT